MSKIVCRKARLDDVPAIVDIAVESVSRDPLPVKINRESMAETARTCLNPAHFMWVAEQDGKVVASVAACVQPSFWFDKLQCSVLLYYTRTPGAGLPLMRELARWVKSRSAIKVAVLELEPGTDPRLVKFLKRVGFDRESLNLSYVRKALA
jgi:N-acetylglutamate synthase-like GNAT family acetyltransferase